MTSARYVVALTGGVASGKTVVARRFEALGVGVHDADAAAREVVALESQGLAEIKAAFGAGVLNPDGSLDRRAMREHVFADPGARERLEAIIHPKVRTWLHRQIELDQGTYCILAIPLLAEHPGTYAWVNRILLVDAPEAVQIERLMRRDDVTREHAERMLAAQATRSQRLAIADDVIVNDRDEAALAAEVAVLHGHYLEFAKSFLQRRS